MSSHFHSDASLLARLVFPEPGFPIMIKHVGLEWRNLNSVCKTKI